MEILEIQKNILGGNWKSSKHTVCCYHRINIINSCFYLYISQNILLLFCVYIFYGIHGQWATRLYIWLYAFIFGTLRAVSQLLNVYLSVIFSLPVLKIEIIIKNCTILPLVIYSQMWFFELKNLNKKKIGYLLL